MNKKIILVVIALLALGASGLLLYQYWPGDHTGATDSGTAQADGSLDAVDQEIKAHREAVLRELDKPADFLEVHVDPKKNLFGESVLDGSIRNKATATRYHDIELMIYWQDEVGAVMDSAAEIIFEDLDPGETLDFKTKRKGPRKSKAILVKLHGAKADEK
jgi:hypothetical protein